MLIARVEIQLIGIEYGKELLDVQITVVITMLHVIFPLMRKIASYDDKSYRYPLTLQLFH